MTTKAIKNENLLLMMHDALIHWDDCITPCVKPNAVASQQAAFAGARCKHPLGCFTMQPQAAL
jgi:hypothetical protein